MREVFGSDDLFRQPCGSFARPLWPDGRVVPWPARGRISILRLALDKHCNCMVSDMTWLSFICFLVASNRFDILNRYDQLVAQILNHSVSNNICSHQGKLEFSHFLLHQNWLLDKPHDIDSTFGDLCKACCSIRDGGVMRHKCGVR